MFGDSVVDTLERLYRLSPELDFHTLFIMNQRLNYRPCRHCAEPRVLDAEDREFIEQICRFNNEDPAQLGTTYLKAGGCEHCESGRKGRVGGYETLLVTPAMLDLLDRQAPTSALWEQAIEGGSRTLQFDLLTKASHGRSTLDEIRRVSEFARYRPA